MEKNPLDKYFAEKLRNHEVAPHNDIWDRIAKEIPNFKAKKKRNVMLYYYGIASTILLVFVLSIILLKENKSTEGNTKIAVKNQKNTIKNPPKTAQKQSKIENITRNEKKISPNATFENNNASTYQHNATKQLLNPEAPTIATNMIEKKEVMESNITNENTPSKLKEQKDFFEKEKEKILISDSKLDDKPFSTPKNPDKKEQESIKIKVNIRLSSQTPEQSLAHTEVINEKNTFVVKIKKLKNGEYNEQLRKRKDRFFALIGRKSDL